MKRITSLLLALVVTILSLFSFTSCGKLIEDGAEISVYLCDEVYDFDPAASYTDDNSVMLMSLLFEPLFTLNEKGKLQKAAAKKYEMDKDTGDLIIELRESYWSDGQRVLAGDFVFAWRRILDPAFSTPAASLLYDVKNAFKAKQALDGVGIYDVGIYADDEKTLRICFEHENVNLDEFLRNLASVMLSPVRAGNVEGQEDYWTKTAGTLYCNGPFKLQQLNYLYGYLTLGRNDGYHRPEDSKKSEDAYVVPAAIRTLWKTDNDLSKGDYLDKMYAFMEEKVVFYVGSLDIDKSAESQDEYSRTALKKKVKTLERLSTYTYVFNTENPLFADPEVRAAMSAVLDRQVIADIIVFADPATGLIPPSVMNHKRNSSFREEGGNLISTSASMTIDQATEVLIEKGVEIGAEFDITYNADHPEEEKVAEYVKEVWDSLGFVVSLIGVSSTSITVGESTYQDSALQQNYESGKFDVIGIDYQMMSANPFPALASASATYGGFATKTPCGWENTDYDKKLEQALLEENAKDKAKLLHEAEALLMDEMPIMPLYFKQTYYIQNKGRLKNVDFGYNGFPIFTKTKLKRYQNYFFDDMNAIFFPEEESES